MRRQHGLLVPITLSHPGGFWDGLQNELVCWLCPEGIVIIQSHVSHPAPGMKQPAGRGTKTEEREGDYNFGLSYLCAVNPVVRCSYEMRP